MSKLAERDRVADNQKLSGLAGNDLSSWLTERGIDTVLVTGVVTNLVVEQTARHGTDLGLTVHPVSHCVAAANDAVHFASLANLDLTTAGCLTAQQLSSPSCPQELIALLDMDPLHPGDAVCLPLLPPARTGRRESCWLRPQPSFHSSTHRPGPRSRSDRLPHQAQEAEETGL
jgi:hypothetical protein